MTKGVSKNGRTSALGRGSLVWLGFSVLLLCGFAGGAGAQSERPAEGGPPAASDAPAREQQVEQQVGQQVAGSISGTVVDQTGAAVAGAQVTLIRGNQSADQQAVADNGQFSFANVTPGPFQLSVTAAGLAPQTLSGVLPPGENYVAPPISLRVAGTFTEVRVEPPPVEVAQAQIKNQEKQRVLAVVPNFYVSYVPDAVSLTPKQKFELAWRTVIDPVTFGMSGVIAGVQQAENQFSGYSAILPSILKQDPRYFYKGMGSRRSRLLYALANAVICKGDNHRWQPNYSNIAGSLAAGGISDLYYPKDAQNRAGLVFENTAIKIGETAILDVFQEFFIRKLTPRVTSHNPAKS